MDILIQSKNVELTSRARLAIKSRIDTVLKNLAHYIDRVSVHFDDINGPKGGDDKQCKVKISLVSMPTIVVVVQEDNAQTAFTIAFAKALATLKRKLKRDQQASQKSLNTEKRRGRAIVISEHELEES